MIAHACKKLGAVKRVERRHAIHKQWSDSGLVCVEARWPLRREGAFVLTVTIVAVQLCGAAVPVRWFGLSCVTSVTNNLHVSIA